jgi:chromosome segregation ATPase
MSVNGPERSRGTVYGAPEVAPVLGAISAPPTTLTPTDASGETRALAEKWLATVSDTQSKNSELQRVQAMAMDRLRAENAQLGAEVTALKDAKAQLQAKVEEATRLNQELARQAAAFKNNHERSLDDVAALKAAADTHEAERAALQQAREELRAAKSEIATLVGRVEELNGVAADLGSKHADAVSAHAVVTELLGVEKEKHGALAEKNGALVEQHGALVEKYNALRAQAATTEERTAETRAELDTTRAKLEATKEKLRLLAKAHEAMAADHAALRAEHTAHVDKHDALSVRHDALVAQSRVDKTALAEHIATSSALEHENAELKAQLAACDATSTTASASATEQRAANAEAQRAAELLNTRAVEAEASLEAALRQRDDELARLKEAYENEKVALQKEIGVCTSEVEKLHSAHLEHIEATKGEKEKLASSNGVLDSELRSVKDRHIKFVSEAMELVTLLNLEHGFTPRMDPSGKMELADMVDQVRAS